LNEITSITLDSQGTLQNAQEIFAAGGPVMPILLALSVVALTVILLKLYQFQRQGIFSKNVSNLAVSHWLTGNKQAAIATLSKSRHPVAVTCLTSMLGVIKPNMNNDKLREEVSRVGNKQINSLNSGLWSLELISTVSPLIGLFGTVLGMINAFKAMQVAGSQVDPSILSGGIWQALLTTAAGLAVAIPVVMVFKWLERTVNHVGEEMEDSVTQLFTSPSQNTEPSLKNNNSSLQQPLTTPSSA